MADTIPWAPRTYEDLLLLPDDGKRHELIDGVHYVTASPVIRHQRILGRLYAEILHFLDDHPSLGEVLLSPVDVVLSPVDVVVPDLLYYRRERSDIVTAKRLVAAPDLVVEILSPSTAARDRELKLRLYERNGVREYWLVDPVGDHVDVRRLAGGRFGEPIRLRADPEVLLTTPELPGFELPLEALFRR